MIKNVEKSGGWVGIGFAAGKYGVLSLLKPETDFDKSEYQHGYDLGSAERHCELEYAEVGRFLDDPFESLADRRGNEAIKR